jgi:hypothetical protein
MTRTRRPRAAAGTSATGATWPDGTPRSQANAFDWRHYEPQINWGMSTKVAKSKVRAAIEMVQGQDYELANPPAVKGTLGTNDLGVFSRKGAVGRQKMLAQRAAQGRSA